jgi:ABC-type transport system involved in multi-copper enzyme maturation permease subunit
MSCVVISLMLLLRRDLTLRLDDWVRVGAIFAVCLLYVAVVFSVSLAVSVAVARSSTAIVALLLVWVVLIVAVPALSGPAAHLLVRPPRVRAVEIEMLERTTSAWPVRDSLNYSEALRRTGLAHGQRWTREQQEQYRQAESEIHGRSRVAAVDSNTAVAGTLFDADERMESLSRWISRISPFGCLQNACLTLANTGGERDRTLHRALEQYHRRYLDSRALGSPGKPPRFIKPRSELRPALKRCLVDVFALTLVGLLCFLVAYSTFLRREVA